MASQFCIEKLQKLVIKKDYTKTVWYDIITNLKLLDICFVFKEIQYKFYKNIQFFLVFTQ